MTPFLSTAMVMFSGLVWVGMLTAFGRSTFTVLVITGIVIRKMMSSTSITSTSGVVLIEAIAPPSSPPTLIAMIGYSSNARRREVRGARRASRYAGMRTHLLVERRSLGRGRTHSTALHARTTDQ